MSVIFLVFRGGGREGVGGLWSGGMAIAGLGRGGGSSTHLVPFVCFTFKTCLSRWLGRAYASACRSLEMHQNLRANVQSLYFAGEHTSAEYYGFLQGAWFEGQMVGNTVANCVKHGRNGCKGEVSYPVLHGTTPKSDYDLENGWVVSSFLVG